MMIDKLLVTGARGGVATLIRPMLATIAKSVRLSDLSDVEELDEHEESCIADLSNYEEVKRAVAGTTAVLHLGGLSTEHSWEDILPANIIGVHNLYRAALNTDHPRILFASSNHAVGAYRFSETIDSNALPKPDSYYGVSKVFGEAVARMYFDKYGIETAIVRIGSCFPEPKDPRMLYTWFSANDLVSLIKKVYEAETLGCPIIYGVSNNSRSFWDNNLTSHLGWKPEDSADLFESVLASPKQLDAATQQGLMEYQGGLWLRSPLVNIED
jgi:uronate dehydrogenase